MAKKLAKKVLLIGWDAADWKVINPLLDKGLMPTLDKLINKGVIGNITTLDPPLSPMLWTSIATGMTADKHGILGFVEPEPNSTKIRTATSTSRKVKAIWNILTQKGFKTHVVGWWPSHPAEPINGVCVSNHFDKVAGEIDKPWPMEPGTVFPANLESTMAQFRIHPEELTGAHILPFVPMAEKVDQEKNKGIQIIAKIMASCSSYHAAATWIMENKEWDFLGVYLDAIDHFCHPFMKFHPPRMNGIPEEDYEIYKDVVTNAYRFHDMMLERLVALAGDDTTIIILSDHGFHSNHLRPKKLPKDPAAPALEHSPYGIFCMKGPHILEDQRIYGASILDITPTVLTLFGLPVGKDMDGKALVQAFNEPILPEYIPSWEEVPGESGIHPASMRENVWASHEGMKQLIELGYIEEPGGNEQEAQKTIVNESKFYLARVYIHSRKYNEALPLLEKLFKEEPAKVRFGLRLASCYQSLNKIIECRQVIEQLRSSNADDLPQLDFLEGSLLLSESKPRKALACFYKAEQTVSHLPYLHIQIGNVYIQMQRWQDAERAFIKALSIDSDDAFAHNGLAICYLRQDKCEEAVEEALNAVGLMYDFPAAHYHLGEALFKAGGYEQAAQAFQVALSLSPGMKKAHEWLIKIYEQHFLHPDKVLFHKKFIAEKIKGTITIVSGLPRSGTSMMMQMLKAGGVDILSDNVRQSDSNNPKGYLEYEKVKRLHIENTWLKEADGKCIKVVAPLLQHLPDSFNYKIIFIHREMGEILRSQQIMLGKEKDVKNNAYPMLLAEAFTKQLEKSNAWIKSQPNVSVMHIYYTDVVTHSLEQAENIRSFLAMDINVENMVSAVDIKLYRNKAVQV